MTKIIYRDPQGQQVEVWADEESLAILLVSLLQARCKLMEVRRAS